MELLLLMAIAYAGARGVEAVIGDTRIRYNQRVANATVKKIAQQGAGKPANTGKGGTFDPTAAAPHVAGAGTKTAAGVATAIEMGATFWKSFAEGYQAAWPDARTEARRRMVERADRRRAKGAGKATPTPPPVPAAPPPPVPAPPVPAVPPAAVGSPPAPAPPAPPSRPTAPPTAPPPAAPPAKTPLVLVKTTPATPAPAPTGGTMSIPEVRTLDGLMNALDIVRGQSLMRAEEAAVIAADDLVIASRLDTIAAQLAGLDVDAATLREVATLQDLVASQADAARGYGDAAQNAADLASGTADATYKAHGGINEAVQSSPIPAAAAAGYYER